jgi:hypothetical protein
LTVRNFEKVPNIYVFGGGNQTTENEIYCLEVMKKQWKNVKLTGEKIAFDKIMGPSCCTVDGKVRTCRKQKLIVT